MKITLSDTVMRDGKVIKVDNKEQEYKYTVISDTIPIFIQDKNGMWIKNPEYVDCNNQL